MPRIKRKSLHFNEDSLNQYINELQNDSYNIRANIIRIRNTWEKKIKDGSDIAMYGKEIISLINAEAKNQDQRIALLKILKDIVDIKVFKSAIGKPLDDDGDKKNVIDADRKDQISQMIEQYNLKNSRIS